MKSEPTTFSIDDLKAAPNQSTSWEGVRNYQARNFMRDQMKVGDRVLYYHSSCPVPGVAGLATVCREAYPDPTSWDSKSEYHDPKSSPENPRWVMVDIKFECKFADVVTLQELKDHPGLQDMLVIRKGQRLSIQPITKEQYDIVCKLGAEKG